MSTSATPETAGSLPRINDPAPDFEAKSTQGQLKLSDMKGKWVVLFSHPADFTPVCSTEFIEFARRADEFKQRGAQLIGLSVDSVPAHIAWIRNIEQHFGVKVDFPVIADLDTKVAQKYGLIHPGASETATVRAVFVIDPNQKVRVPPPQTIDDAAKRMEDDFKSKNEVTDWYLSKRDLSKQGQ